MAVLDFTTTAQAPARPTQRMPFGNLPNNDRPRAKVWLNIGYETKGKFINLPIGLPIDTMEAAEVRGQNADWVKQRTAQNALLEAIQKLGAEIAPGEEKILNLEVRVRRVNEELAVAASDNEYTVDLADLVIA